MSEPQQQKNRLPSDYWIIAGVALGASGHFYTLLTIIVVHWLLKRARPQFDSNILVIVSGCWGAALVETFNIIAWGRNPNLIWEPVFVAGVATALAYTRNRKWAILLLVYCILGTLIFLLLALFGHQTPDAYNFFVARGVLYLLGVWLTARWLRQEKAVVLHLPREKTGNVNEKVAALIFVSLFYAWCVQEHSSTELAKIDSMNPGDYIQHARHAYQQSYSTLFYILLRKAGIFFVAYEMLTFLIQWLRQVSLSGGTRSLDFMSRQELISKLVALILVILCFAWYTQNHNSTGLAKLESMSPADFIQYKRHVYQSPTLGIYIIQFVMSGLFICSLEGIAYAIRCISKKSRRTEALPASL